MSIKLSILILLSLFFILSISSCDGLFPTAPKSNIPDDHTAVYGGFYHKSFEHREDISDCLTCHTLELQGKLSIINGVNTWANSCYQCHGNVWEREGGN